MKPQLLRNCLYCNKEFIVHCNWPSQTFCSRDCGYKNRRGKTPYSIETFCKCGCGSIILNPDDHNRYRKFLPEHRNSNGTHPRLGYKESEEHIKIRMQAIYAHFRKEPSGIEKELYSYLDNLKIEYEKQKQIGRTRPDAFIPKLNLCIYADGFFWHSSKERREIDERCNKSLYEKGYLVLRLPSIKNGYHISLRPLQEFLLQSFQKIFSGSMP
jgi:very-short-patch-repair endonuclease